MFLCPIGSFVMSIWIRKEGEVGSETDHTNQPHGPIRNAMPRGKMIILHTYRSWVGAKKWKCVSLKLAFTHRISCREGSKNHAHFNT